MRNANELNISMLRRLDFYELIALEDALAFLTFNISKENSNLTIWYEIDNLCIKHVLYLISEWITIFN